MIAEIGEMSRRWGSNCLLVQGAGGNVSWKDGDILWIKASGLSLRDADGQSFIPVSLSAVRAGDPVESLVATDHRPSIETRMHAVIPQTFVVHLHAIDVLAYLVRQNWDAALKGVLGPRSCTYFIPYHRPGDALADAIARLALIDRGEPITLLLQNHGIVVGGPTLDAVSTTIDGLVGACARALVVRPIIGKPPAEPPRGPYRWIADGVIQALMTDPSLADRIEREWALYPDHVVFLGAEPAVVSGAADPVRSGYVPRLLFIRDTGVAASPDFTAAQHEQLRCYAQVLARVPPNQPLTVLPDHEVQGLLGWDAEEHRQRIAEAG